MTGFADLAVITNFSFLRGASHPEELVDQANAHGLSGLGIADRNSLAGVVRAFTLRQGPGAGTGSMASARRHVAARLVFEDGTPGPPRLPAATGAAYANLLTRLLSTRQPQGRARGDCEPRPARTSLDHGPAACRPRSPWR